MKKILTLLVTVLMVFSFTAKVNADTYTIEIDNAVEGETYNAYKIFDVTYAEPKDPAPESPSDDAPAPDASNMHKAYSYTIEKGSYWWTVIVGTATATDGVYTANGLKFSPTANGTTYVVEATEDFDAAAFAAVLNAAENKPDADATGTGPDADNLPLVLTVTEPGYYFVDTTLGSLCSLDTTEPKATIREKNLTTSVVKYVKEDSAQGDAAWGKWNDADYGQVVEFKSVITIGAHQKNVVYHDILQTAKLALDTTSITVTGATVSNADKFTVVTSGNDLPTGDTFAVFFDTEWTEGLTEATTVTITYKATVTLDAIIGEQLDNNGDPLAMGQGNDNQCKVTYGKAQETNWDWTRTYVWEFDLFKFHLDDENNQIPLADAKFNLLYGDNALQFVQLDDETIVVGEGQNAKEITVAVYRLAVDGDSEDDITTELVTPESGIVIVRGLDADEYVLKETEAPKGYNKLKEDLTVTLTSEGSETVGEEQLAELTVTPNSDEGHVEIENKTGAELPSTGGIGTTIFRVAGALMVLGAGIILIAKKKANN